MLGVTLFEHRNTVCNYALHGSINFYINGSGIYVSGSNKNECKHSCSDGERIRVTIDMIGGTICWEHTHPTYLLIGTVFIPENMRQKQLYLYIDFDPGFDGVVTVL
jgi:hypothetical protein